MALYDKDGKLQSVKIKNETAAPKGTGTIRTENANIDNSAGAAYVKLFLWENGMKPLYNSITIKEAK